MTNSYIMHVGFELCPLGCVMVLAIWTAVERAIGSGVRSVLAHCVVFEDIRERVHWA